MGARGRGLALRLVEGLGRGEEGDGAVRGYHARLPAGCDVPTDWRVRSCDWLFAESAHPGAPAVKLTHYQDLTLVYQRAVTG